MGEHGEQKHVLLMALKRMMMVESHNEVVPTQGATTLMALIMNKRYMVMLIHLIARLLVMM
jgi:hypothetical protein